MTTEEKVREILEDIDDSIDYEAEEKLVDDGLLDSFGIITLIGELEEEFDVKIGPAEIVAENFNSCKALAQMVERLS